MTVPHGRPNTRRLVVLLTPVAVPSSMAVLFAVLGRRLPPRAAYNVGFAIYWVGWCVGVPVAVLGPRQALRVLAAGRRPSSGETVALVLPVLGGAFTEFLPRRRLVDRRVLAMMIGSAAVNAIAEELLWRGMFLQTFPDDLVRGSVWPLAGFSAWHLAPQIVLPSRHGRAGFVVGAAAVGAASAFASWRTRGLRWVLLPHAATDACGVTAARFRLGLMEPAGPFRRAADDAPVAGRARVVGPPRPVQAVLARDQRPCRAPASATRLVYGGGMT
jgi:membrane protease YdiL (CAAX protease family)